MLIATFPYKKEAVEFVLSNYDEKAREEVNIEFHKEAGAVALSLSNLRNAVNKIIEHPRCSSYEIFIEGKGNFRYDIDPNYKGKRDPNARPIHEMQLRAYLCKRYQAKLVPDIETDDEVSIRCMEDQTNNVICSIDKDLWNTPGWHYNFNTEKASFVSEEEANLNFYRQILVGDKSVDNIEGLKGYGKVTAAKLLPESLPIEEMCAIVWAEYEKKGKDWQFFKDQGQLLWMLRERDVMWEPPLSEGCC